MNEKEKQLKKIFDKIKKYNDGKHDNKIINLCDEGLKIDSKNPKLYFYKANSLYQLALYNKNSDKYLEAINHYNIVFNIEPNNKVSHYNRGLCYFYLALSKNNNKEYLNKAIENFDNLIIHLKEFEKNIKTENERIELNKRYGESYSIRGSSYINLHKYYKALDDLNIAIKYDSECGEYYYNRGLCYYNLGTKNKEIENNNFELAIKDLNKALELGFNNIDVYLTRGLSYFALSISENNYEYIFFSIKDFNVIIDSDMNNGKAYFHRGLSYYELEEFGNSINDFKRSIELNFYDRDTFLYISSSYFNLQNYEEAINNINQFIEKNSNSEKGYLNRAMSYINLYLRKDKNYNEYYSIIEKDFNKAMELKPNDEFIYSKIGGLYYTLEDYEKCLNIFSKVIKLNKENDSAYYHIGLSYHKLKNYDEAIKNYELSEQYCKYNHNKLSIQDKKIESLLKLSNKESEICNIYNNNVLELYEEFYNETIFYSYDFFNISSSITENILSLKNKINIDENSIIKNNKKIINKAIQDNFYTQNYYFEIKNNSLYNYTKVNKDTLRSILNNTLWCSNTKNFNDPVDPYIRNFRKEQQNKFYDYLLDKIKISCLTTHNDNTLMWSHYAEKHQGICIEYDINKIFNEKNDKILIKKISYNKKMISYDTFMNKERKSINIVLIDNKTIDNITDLFTIKSKEWEYEDEYRILFYDEKNKNTNGTLINLPIKSICFGVQTSKEDKELVYNVVEYINKKNRNKNGKKYKRIKLYQAELDDNELFKINIKPYKHKKRGVL